MTRPHFEGARRGAFLDKAAVGGVVVVAGLGIAYATRTDHTAPILAFIGAILLALIAAFACPVVSVRSAAVGAVLADFEYVDDVHAWIVDELHRKVAGVEDAATAAAARAASPPSTPSTPTTSSPSRRAAQTPPGTCKRCAPPATSRRATIWKLVLV